MRTIRALTRSIFILGFAGGLASCETTGHGQSYPPPPTYAEQQVAVLQQENQQQEQEILALSRNVGELRRMVCLLVVRLEKVQVRSDPRNASHNYVVATDGPLRSEAQCQAGGR